MTKRQIFVLLFYLFRPRATQEPSNARRRTICLRHLPPCEVHSQKETREEHRHESRRYYSAQVSVEKRRLKELITYGSDIFMCNAFPMDISKAFCYPSGLRNSVMLVCFGLEENGTHQANQTGLWRIFEVTEY